ncbi:MAG: DNA glycosylase [Opitutaceae bacterium]|nr:DNA glycosylase [Opitutaceae bacterium]
MSLAPAVLAETLAGGQAFRWRGDAAGVWTGQWADCVTRLRIAPDGSLEWSAPAILRDRVAVALPHYLATDVDWVALADTLPWRSDTHLAAAIRAFPGLRLLRQPFGETLLGFLCSATKQIAQIQQICALLATGHGRETVAGFHALPTWDELALVSEKNLRQCQLGFRARHIAATARFLKQHPGWLAETEQLPYIAARSRLMELPGVGGKIADCVLLFGAGRLEAFPVDVWISRTLERHYGLDGWPPAQLVQFGQAHFGPLAGLAQQYLFADERRLGRRPQARPPTPLPPSQACQPNMSTNS